MVRQEKTDVSGLITPCSATFAKMSCHKAGKRTGEQFRKGKLDSQNNFQTERAKA